MRKQRLFSVSLLSLGLLLSAPAAAHAAGAEAAVSRAAPSKAEIKRITARYNKTGKLSQADIKTLKKDKRVASRFVYAPYASTGAKKDIVQRVAGGKKCYTADRYIVYKTLLGARSFDWHGVLKYCVKDGKVVSAKPSYYLARVDRYSVDTGVFKTFNRKGLKTKNFSITLQGQVKNEVPVYGTWVVHRPTISYKVKGNGKYTVAFKK